MALDGCKIIKQSGLSDSNCTDLNSDVYFFVTAPALGLYN